MKTQSAKAKGRKLQKEIVAMILETFPELQEDDVVSRSMGVSGTDVMLSPKAQQLFPYAVEAKNKERLNVWEAIQQSEKNSGDLTPVLFFTRNRTKTYVCIEATEFMKLTKKANGLQR